MLLLYLHQLANLGADRVVVVVGAFNQDAVAQLCSPSTSRAEYLTVVRSNENHVVGVARGEEPLLSDFLSSKRSLDLGCSNNTPVCHVGQLHERCAFVHARERHRGKN